MSKSVYFAIKNLGDCPICLEGIRKKDVITKLTCNHIFHRKCIDSWFESGSIACPLCRVVQFSEKTSTFQAPYDPDYWSPTQEIDPLDSTDSVHENTSGTEYSTPLQSQYYQSRLRYRYMYHFDEIYSLAASSITTNHDTPARAVPSLSDFYGSAEVTSTQSARGIPFNVIRITGALPQL